MGACMIAYISLSVQGACTTLGVWLLASCASIALGTLLALLNCRYISLPLISRAIPYYVFVVKGIPVYVHLLLAYFVLPACIGIPISAIVAGVLALTVCSSGYVAEIIRSGIDAVPAGQWQAAYVLGYSPKQAMMRILLPQALRISLPALFGELEQLLKSSSLLATIGIFEVTRTAMNIISRELNPIPVYILLACVYLVFSGLLLAVRTLVKRNIYA